MTIICGVRTASGTWIGGDTLIANGNTKYGHSQKWVHGRRLSIGLAGNVVAARALERHILKFKPEMDSFSIWKLMRFVYKSVGLNPVDKPESADAPHYGNTFLFATADRLLMFASDGGSVSGDVGEFYARGSGCEFASGAWSGITRVEMLHPGAALHPRVKMRFAIEAACDGDRDCDGTPYVGFWTKNGRA